MKRAMADDTKKPSDDQKPEDQKPDAAGSAERAPDDAKAPKKAEAVTSSAEKPQAKESDKKSSKPATASTSQAAAPEPESQASKPKPKKTSPLRTIIVTALITLLLGAGALTYWRADILSALGLSEGGASSDQVAALETRIAELEKAARDGAARDEEIAQDIAERTSELETLVQGLSESNGAATDEAIANNIETARQMLSALETKMAEFEAATGEANTMSGNSDAATEPQVVVGASPEEVAELRQSFSSLASRFEAIDKDLAQSETRIEALEEAAPDQNLDDVLNTLSPRTEVQSLEERLKVIEATKPAEAARAAVVALSATELARAAATSAPFADELEAFVQLAPESDIDASISLYAATGVPTRETLRTEFALVSDQIVEAERLREGDGFFTRLWNKITSLVTIRRVGEIEGNHWQAVLARAENRMASGDLDAAAAELETLEGPAARAAADWVARVKARKALDGFITRLKGEAFKDLLGALEEN